MRSCVELESDEDPALIAALIHNARGGCYAEAGLAEPVPVEAEAVLNGAPLDLDAYPASRRACSITKPIRTGY